MERRETNYLKSILISGLGFGVGGVLGNFVLYLLVRSQVLKWPLSLVPEDQQLVVLVTAIVLVVLAIGLSTGIGGALGGYALSIIDPIYPRRKYIWRTAIASGVAEGLLIVPLLLFTAILSLYNNGLDREPTGFILVFGVYGVIYGIVMGLVLGFATLEWRQVWRVLLASIIGFGLGGAAMGYGLRVAYYPTTLGEPLPEVAIVLPILTFVFFLLGGLFLGWVYEWVTQWRVDNVPEEPARWVKVAGVLTAILLAVFVVSNYRQLIKFLTIRPGSVSTHLQVDAVGVHWKGNEVLARNVSPGDEYPISISAAESGLAAAAWMGRSAGISEIYSSLLSNVDQGWQNPTLISPPQEFDAVHPDIDLDEQGNRHIVWAGMNNQGASILYTSCTGDTCDEPISLSSSPGNICEGIDTGDIDPLFDWPVVSTSGDSSVMVMWTNPDNLLFYSSWDLTQAPPSSPTGCLVISDRERGAPSQLHPQISGHPDGSFNAVFSVLEPDFETVYQLEYLGDDWDTPQSLGGGKTPEVYTTPGGITYYAWCDDETKLRIKESGTDLVDVIEFPSCNSRPAISMSESGEVHVAWYSSEIRNNLNVVSSGNIIYESILTEQGWSEPAIVAETDGYTLPVLAGKGGGDLQILWSDNDGLRLHSAYQPMYHCSEESLGEISQVMLDVIQSGAYRSQDSTVPYCENDYERLIYMPNPEEAYSSQPQNENGGFDDVSSLADLVKYEVVLSVMEWSPDEQGQGLNPGSVYTREIAKLYQQIKESPERYPRGLTIRILLGNYPEMANLEWGEQIWSVIEDLRNAGVDKMVDSNLGWNVEIANYEGVYPHSHTKFLVVDGTLAVGAGFNYGHLHFPFDHPSNKGGDLYDLGLVMRGPIAQQVLSTFDDYWQGADQLFCPDLSPDPGFLWTRDCIRSEAQATHVPEVKKYFIPETQDIELSHAFSLNRNYKFKESDDVIKAALASSRESLDILEVNFSLNLICMLDLLNDDVCSYDNSLDYMKAIMTAVEENHTRVRVLVEKVNSNGMENRVAAKEFTRELEKRGLDQYVEIRFFEGRMHAKAFLIDEEVLVVGSQNFHYSAWGERGLAEYNLATDDPQAISEFKSLFEYYWDTGIPWQDYK